jgi:hypothetical protein
MEQETAVEWFFDRLKNHEIQSEHYLLYLKAKAMGKEQMIDFAKQWETRKNEGNLDSMEMLYNETYNK